MRFLAYVIAVLAAAGIIYFLSLSPQPIAATGDGGAAATSADRSTADPAPSSPAGGEAQRLVTLNVPDMHCPFGCYPSVKKTLEQQPGVLAVDLAQQKEEGVIDNPQVLVKFDEKFDRQSAIDSLAKAGFAKATVVQ